MLVEGGNFNINKAEADQHLIVSWARAFLIKTGSDKVAGFFV